MKNNQFGVALREAIRTLPGVTNKQFAKMAGLDESILSRVLTGERAANPEYVGKAAKHFPKTIAQDLIRIYLQEVATEIAKKQRAVAPVVQLADKAS